jgi:hypothetical protein
MRYVLAITISVILTGAMFLFDVYMAAWEKQWAGVGVKLPNAAMIAISIAYFIRCYWYVFAVLFLVVSLSAAALWPTGAAVQPPPQPPEP